MDESGSDSSWQSFLSKEVSSIGKTLGVSAGPAVALAGAYTPGPVGASLLAAGAALQAVESQSGTLSRKGEEVGSDVGNTIGKYMDIAEKEVKGYVDELTNSGSRVIQEAQDSIYESTMLLNGDPPPSNDYSGEAGDATSETEGSPASGGDSGSE